MAVDCVLALDLASTSGWAYGPVRSKPMSGVIPLGDKGATHGERGAKLLRWLNDFLKLNAVRLAVIEKPLAPQVLVKIGATDSTVELLYGLPFVAKTVLSMRGVWEVKYVHVQDVRAHFTGQRTFAESFDPIRKRKVSSRENGKAAVKNICAMRGWPVQSDDEADAIATWSYGTEMLSPGASMKCLQIFGRRINA